MALGEDRPINQWNIIENNITFPTNGTGTWTFTGKKKKKKKKRKKWKKGGRKTQISYLNIKLNSKQFMDVNVNYKH